MKWCGKICREEIDTFCKIYTPATFIAHQLSAHSALADLELTFRISHGQHLTDSQSENKPTELMGPGMVAVTFLLDFKISVALHALPEVPLSNSTFLSCSYSRIKRIICIVINLQNDNFRFLLTEDPSF